MLFMVVVTVGSFAVTLVLASTGFFESQRSAAPGGKGKGERGKGKGERGKGKGGRGKGEGGRDPFHKRCYTSYHGTNVTVRAVLPYAPVTSNVSV